MSTLQNFDTWNEKKQVIDKKTRKIYFLEQEIWLVALGKNIGFEINGKGQNFLRPIIVYKKFSPHQCLCIPIFYQRNFLFLLQTSIAFFSEPIEFCAFFSDSGDRQTQMP